MLKIFVGVYHILNLLYLDVILFKYAMGKTIDIPFLAKKAKNRKHIVVLSLEVVLFFYGISSFLLIGISIGGIHMVVDAYLNGNLTFKKIKSGLKYVIKKFKER